MASPVPAVPAVLPPTRKALPLRRSTKTRRSNKRNRAIDRREAGIKRKDSIFYFFSYPIVCDTTCIYALARFA